MNICIFPGTFNPIHIAHLKMAQIALEKYGFDKIIFVPAYIPPHKKLANNLANHRYNMVKLATNKNSRFEVSDIEYKTECKSYTLYTVKKLRTEYGIKDRLNMIIGTDAFAKIKTWHKANELKDLVHFIVFPRGNDILNKEEFAGYSYELVDTDQSDISSTEIRKEHIGGTVKEVEEYIIKNELYN